MISPKTLTHVFAACCLAVTLVGCNSMGGKSPEEAINDALDTYQTGLVEQNVDTIMLAFAENFEHYEWGDKAGAREFMSQAADMGYLEDIELIRDEMELEIEGDSAVAYPIDLEGSFGALTLELTFGKQDDGAWLITGLDAAGL